MQGDMCYGRLRSPQHSPGKGHGEESFPRKEVALGLLGFTWKDEEAKGVGLGMSFLAEGAECAKAWKREATRAACGFGWGCWVSLKR